MCEIRERIPANQLPLNRALVILAVYHDCVDGVTYDVRLCCEPGSTDHAA